MSINLRAPRSEKVTFLTDYSKRLKVNEQESEGPTFVNPAVRLLLDFTPPVFPNDNPWDNCSRFLQAARAFPAVAQQTLKREHSTCTHKANDDIRRSGHRLRTNESACTTGYCTAASRIFFSKKTMRE